MGFRERHGDIWEWIRLLVALDTLGLDLLGVGRNSHNEGMGLELGLGGLG